jgi:hypothetical protein
MHHIVLGQGLFCDATAVSLVLATETIWKQNNKKMLYDYEDNPIDYDDARPNPEPIKTIL